MSFSHTLTLSASLLPGTTEEQVLHALQPMAEYWGAADFKDAARLNRYVTYEYAQDQSSMHIHTEDEVGHDYEEAIKKSAQLLSQLVSRPTEFSFTDEDENHPEPTLIMVAPTEEDADRYLRQKAVDEAMDKISPFLHDVQYREVKKMIELAVDL